ncbi:putative motility protein [Pseudorhodoferax sp.]|uniref:putative motility protein n=1 Tax=Pseudorhodoferax sp. TaxID=1993553 RepID=UPI002DD69D46|nr:putative motility protein [Pseudorhodoferax sp.]
MDTTLSTAAVTPASEARPGTVRSAAAIHVLREALDAEASSALALLNQLPQAPALATSGALGTRLDTYA